MTNNKGGIDNFSLIFLIVICVLLVLTLFVFMLYNKYADTNVVYINPPQPVKVIIVNFSDDDSDLNISITDSNISNSTCKYHLPYQDSNCTPGDSLNVTTEIICVSGYSSTVRNVSYSKKIQVATSYGVTNISGGSYEIDHLIPLSIGGSNEITNLWPQPANPRPGYKEKDTIERFVLKEVCNNRMSIQEAQQIMISNWTLYIKGE